MNYIELNSVGSSVTNEGNVFPIDISEAPETASDAEEMMGVSIFDVSDEWIESLSSDNLISLISFLDEHIGFDVDNPSQIHCSYNEWRTQTWNHWETMNNLYMNLESLEHPPQQM